MPVIDWDGIQKIGRVFDPDSQRSENGRLAPRVFDTHRVNGSVIFDGQNPVRYIDNRTCGGAAVVFP